MKLHDKKKLESMKSAYQNKIPGVKSTRIIQKTQMRKKANKTKEVEKSKHPTTHMKQQLKKMRTLLRI